MTDSPPSTPPAHSRPLVVGILGGIASGKSTAAELLAGPDGLVLDADSIAHEVLASDEVTAKVREHFGASVLDASGRPDRRALGALVFDPVDGPGHRQALEGWIHPRVRATILSRLEAARAARVSCVVLDVPLLLENDSLHHLVDACHALVFVDVPHGARRARAADRGWEPGELERREASQLPLREKRARADHVLPNDGDLDLLRVRVTDLRTRLFAALDRATTPPPRG